MGGAGATEATLPAVAGVPDAASLVGASELGTGAALWIAAAGVLFIGIYPGPLLWAAQGAVRLILGG